MAERFDALFPIPWAAPLLSGSGATGGAETQVLMVARALAASGLNVGILVIGERTELPAEVDGVTVLTQPPPPRRRGVAGLMHDLTTLAALLRAPAAVIVQRNASRGVAIAALAARLRRAGFVYSSASVVDFDLGRVDRAYNVWLYERALRRADQIVVQDQEQARLCRAKFGREPVVIPSIVEPAARRG